MILDLPTVGIQGKRPRIDTLCDWIEAQVAFVGASVSRSSLLDSLMEQNVYVTQDGANAALEEVWRELRWRVDALRSEHFIRVEDRRIERRAGWREVPAYAFCLYLSLLHWYPVWAKAVVSRAGYAEQGALFEEVTLESLRRQGWSAELTGWSRLNASKLPKVVDRVSDWLRDPIVPGGVDKWASADENEAGLDVVCWRDFRDERASRPLYLVQVASGADWWDKLHTPDVERWGLFIQFSHKPGRAFALPYALLASEFQNASGRVRGMLMDRVRVLSPGQGLRRTWPTPALGMKLKRWVAARVDKLPRSS